MVDSARPAWLYGGFCMSAETLGGPWSFIDPCGCLSARRSRFDDPVPDRVPHEVAHRVEIELGHDLRSMCLRRLGRHAEHCANLLVRPPFGEELQDFTLARREPYGA